MSDQKKKYDILEMDMYGEHWFLKPHVGLYDVEDFMGNDLHAIGVWFDECDASGKPTGEEFGTVTVNLGDYLSVKNGAYLDVNNLPGIEKILEGVGIAKDTGLMRHSGFVSYPLYIFSEDFLKEVDPEVYEKYSQEFDRYEKEGPFFGVDEEDVELDADGSEDYSSQGMTGIENGLSDDDIDGLSDELKDLLSTPPLTPEDMDRIITNHFEEGRSMLRFGIMEQRPGREAVSAPATCMEDIDNGLFGVIHAYRAQKMQGREIVTKDQFDDVLSDLGAWYMKAEKGNAGYQESDIKGFVDLFYQDDGPDQIYDMVYAKTNELRRYYGIKLYQSIFETDGIEFEDRIPFDHADSTYYGTMGVLEDEPVDMMDKMSTGVVADYVDKDMMEALSVFEKREFDSPHDKAEAVYDLFSRVKHTVRRWENWSAYDREPDAYVGHEFSDSVSLYREFLQQEDGRKFIEDAFVKDPDLKLVPVATDEKKNVSLRNPKALDTIREQAENDREYDEV